jgi:hypothetical protein
VIKIRAEKAEDYAVIAKEEFLKKHIPILHKLVYTITIK